MVANHGQAKKYVHEVIGCNSRLDSIQAAILNVKLKYLDSYSQARNDVAAFYDDALKDIEELRIPFRMKNSSHVFHQYTLRIKNGRRDKLQSFLKENGVPTMIYYPIPLYKQKAFLADENKGQSLLVTETLCKEVISLPIHTEMNDDQLSFIIDKVYTFFN